MSTTSTQAVTSWIGSLLPLMTAIIGGLWVAFTYLADHREAALQQATQIARDHDVRLREAQKPFLDKQLALYFETAQVVGVLAGSMPKEPDGVWEKNRARFEQLYWSELSMVETPAIEQAMVAVRNKIVQLENDRTNSAARHELEISIYQLAHAIRDGIRSAWTYQSQ